MASNMTRVLLLLAAVAAVASAVPSPAPAESQKAEGSPARTIPRRGAECRPGLCPHIQQLVPDQSHSSYLQQSFRSGFISQPSICGNLCSHDHECPSHQKCCPTTCGYTCRDTVHLYDEDDEY